MPLLRAPTREQLLDLAGRTVGRAELCPPVCLQQMTSSDRWSFPRDLVGKNLPANAGDPDLIPGWGRSPGGRNGRLLKYTCL